VRTYFFPSDLIEIRINYFRKKIVYHKTALTTIFKTISHKKSSADITETGSPKRSLRNYRSIDNTRRTAPNNETDQNEDHSVRLFGFRRIGTVFPAGLTKNVGYAIEQRFLTLPNKKHQVRSFENIFTDDNIIFVF